MAKRRKRKLKNKIGFVNNKHLRIYYKKGGHYVFIRKVNKNGTCDVNVLTSLEHRNKQTKKLEFTDNKIRHLKLGNSYAIPKTDTNLPKWSGVKKEVKVVDTKHIKNVNRYYIKKRHWFFIGKYLNKRPKSRRNKKKQSTETCIKTFKFFPDKM